MPDTPPRTRRALLNELTRLSVQQGTYATPGGRREGQLVAVRSGTGTVHASRLIYATGRPDLGLTPWWTLCASAVVRHETTEQVSCKTCLRLLKDYDAKIGDILDA